MKKLILFITAILLVSISTKAVELAENDTTIRFNNKTIHIEDSIGQIKVKIYDQNDTPYEQLYEGVFTDGKSYEKWTVMEEIGIQLPFLTKSKSQRKYSMEPHWAGIGWGFANIADQNLNFNNIDGVSLKSESSNEFFFNLIEKILPIYRNNIGLTTGLGFNWRNYFLDMNKHMVEVDGITDVYNAPADVNYEYSRLRTFHLTIPLLLEWQPTFGRSQKFFVSAGVIGGVNTFASYKVKYKDTNNNTIRDVEGKGLNVAPVSLDFHGQIGYGSWNVYAKYSPFSIFQSQKGPDIRAVSVGAMLNF
ncbi:MAG: outer membrane beta-barrel protein [Paludibacter sp.]|nr:outer membrane beta-barrel protein [Paludibacter sp.]